MVMRPMPLKFIVGLAGFRDNTAIKFTKTKEIYP